MNTKRKTPENTEIRQILQKIMRISKTGFCKYDFTRDQHFFCADMLSWFSEREHAIIQKKGLIALLPMDRPKDVNKAILSAFAQKKQSIEFVEHIGLDKKGLCIFNINLDLNYDADGSPLGMLIIVHDVTRQEKARILLLNQKNISDKNAQFRANQIANMSHEIRTPMGGVIGMADVLLGENHDEKTIQKIKIIKQSAETMMQILTETLDHCKMMANGVVLKPTDISPKDLLEPICLLWQDQASKNNTKISCVYSQDLPDLIRIDVFRLKQCLNNLLSNAVKFTKNGKINIIMKTIRRANKQPQLLIMVQDTGIGMTPEQQEKIFTPYAQGDDNITQEFGGTGLGMSIIQEIIHAMKGRIIVKSKKDIGTTTGLLLPLDQAAAVTPVKAMLNGLVATGVKTSSNTVSDINAGQVSSKKTDERANILVVDDILTNRLVLEYMLHDLAANLEFAKNGQEAIDILNERSVDLILMDVHMPILNGIEATRAIRTSDRPYKDIPIFAVTADAEYHKRVTCQSVGFDGIIAKPVNKSDLLEMINQKLAKPKCQGQNAGSLFAQ